MCSALRRPKPDAGTAAGTGTGCRARFAAVCRASCVALYARRARAPRSCCRTTRARLASNEPLAPVDSGLSTRSPGSIRCCTKPAAACSRRSASRRASSPTSRAAPMNSRGHQRDARVSRPRKTRCSSIACRTICARRSSTSRASQRTDSCRADDLRAAVRQSSLTA